MPLKYSGSCNSPGFRSDQVDSTVWEWLVWFLSDPKALETGLWAHRQEVESANKPLRERLDVVEDLLTNNRAQLERLLDLYLAGDFSREILTERKARLEATITALEKEQANLLAHLKARVLTTAQIQTIQEFAAKVTENLAAMHDDFEMKRRLVEELDVHVTLAVDDEKKVIYARCLLGEDVFLTSNTIHSTRHKANMGLTLTARLVLDCTPGRRDMQARLEVME